MHCYTHRTKEAVAVCRHCGKAVCADCCEDTGQGIACSRTCAHELEQNRLLTARLKQNYGIGFKPPMPASVPTYFFFGLILLLTSFTIFFNQGRIDILTIAMAAIFFVMALGSYKRYRDNSETCDTC